MQGNRVFGSPKASKGLREPRFETSASSGGANQEARTVDRRTKERKLVALMANDLGAGMGEREMAEAEEEVRSLPDEDLDRTLAGRLDLPYPVDEEVLERVLARVEEPEEREG